MTWQAFVSLTGRLAAAAPRSHRLAAAVAAGLSLSLLARPPWLVPASLAGAAALSATVLAPGRRLGLVSVALVLIGLAFGGARLERLDASTLQAAAGDAGPAVVEVTGPARRGEFAQRIPVRIHELWHRPISEAAQLRLPVTVAAPAQGARLALVATVRAPRGPEPGGSFDERRTLARQGIHAVLSATSYRVIGHRGGLAGAMDRLRERLAGGIAPGLTGERRALVSGIVLGADEGLTSSLRQAFRASGLYHLLAVSGQNVAYVAAGVVLLVWLLGAPRRIGEGAALLAIAGYVGVVGWQPSVVRAGIAGGLTSLAWIADRTRDRWYFALVGAAILLAWNPYTLLDPGFQLSFAAVAAIFVLSPRLERFLDGYPLPAWLRSVLAISTACSVATAPILWWQFDALPVFAVPANALAAPVVAPILGLGLLAALLDLVLPGAAASLAWVNGWLVSYLAWLARTVSGLPGAVVASPTAIALGALVLVTAIGVSRAPRRSRRPLGVAALVALLGGSVALLPRSSGALPAPAALRIALLDIGQGDSILLQVPEGAVLVDQGPPEGHVERLLDHLGVDRLSALVLTHPQRDHVGGAAAVLHRFHVDAVLDPGLPSGSADEARARGEAAARHVPIVTVRAGQRYRLGRLSLRVLWPATPGPPGADPNGYATVLLASYGAIDVLLTADAESDVTGRLALPPVEILKVAHHGSADPGLRALLDRLRPRIALISVGRGNDYGHPAPETLAALADRPHLLVYRTDEDGTVVLETDGGSITVREGV